MGVPVLAQAMEGGTQANQGNDYAIFGGGHWKKKGRRLARSIKGVIGGFKNALGGFIGGAFGFFSPLRPEFGSMTDEEYFESLK